MDLNAELFIITVNKHIHMQNSTVTWVTTNKIPQNNLDHRFKSNDHITYAKSTILKSIDILYKIQRFLEMNTLIQMYHSFVFPYFIYCIEIFGNASAIHLDSLIKIQKTITITITITITFSEFLAPLEPLFQKTNIINFDKLVFQRICLMMFKQHIGDVPKPI